MTHRGPKLAAQEQARGRMEGQCPGEENSHINVTVQGAEESRDWSQGRDYQILWSMESMSELLTAMEVEQLLVQRYIKTQQHQI